MMQPLATDTLGVVVVADGLTLHLSRDLAWLVGLVTLIGLGTCLFGLVGWWHDLKDAVRGAVRRRVAS